MRQLAIILFIVLLVVKLAGVAISWWVVFLPLILAVVITLIGWAMVLGFFFLGAKKVRRPR